MAKPSPPKGKIPIDLNFLELRKIVRTHGKYVMRRLFDDYELAPIEKKVTPSCFLCGTEENITKEHVLPRWVFESNSNHSFVTASNKQSKTFIRATIPACRRCNSELLNGIEQYIQKTLAYVDLKATFYSAEDWDNIIRWLEIIDFKFQVWKIMTKFTRHKNLDYIPGFAHFSVAFMQDLSYRNMTTNARRALRRIGTKDKKERVNSLMIASTIQKTFYYLHSNGNFLHLEIPTYNKFFFYFFEKKFRSNKTTIKKAMEIIHREYKIKPAE